MWNPLDDEDHPLSGYPAFKQSQDTQETTQCYSADTNDLSLLRSPECTVSSNSNFASPDNSSGFSKTGSSASEVLWADSITTIPSLDTDQTSPVDSGGLQLQPGTSHKRRAVDDIDRSLRILRPGIEQEPRNSPTVISCESDASHEPDIQNLVAGLQPGVQLTHGVIHSIIDMLAIEQHVRWYDPGNLDDLDSISSWTPASISQGDIPTVITPFNLPLSSTPSNRNGHWIVFKFDVFERNFWVYDSARSITSILSNKIHEIGERIGNALLPVGTAGGPDLIAQWTQSNVKNIPQQTNNNDCGIFAIYFCLCLSVQENPLDCFAPLWRKIWSSLLTGNCETPFVDSHNMHKDSIEGWINHAMRPKLFEQHMAPSIALAKSLLQNAETHRANSSRWNENYKEHVAEIENYRSEGIRLISKIEGSKQLISQNNTLSQSFMTQAERIKCRSRLLHRKADATVTSTQKQINYLEILKQRTSMEISLCKRECEKMLPGGNDVKVKQDWVSRKKKLLEKRSREDEETKRQIQEKEEEIDRMTRNRESFEKAFKLS